MKFNLIIIMLSASLLTSCATWMNKPMKLMISVEPRIITPGSLVSINVESPVKLINLTGRINQLGSPVLPLKSEDGIHWTWTTQVPMEAAWQSGRYQLIFEGKTHGQELLFGEAWVEAP